MDSLCRRHAGKPPGGQQIGDEGGEQGAQRRHHKGLPGEKIEGGVLLHAGDDPAGDAKVQPKSQRPAGNQPQQRDRAALLQQHPADLAGRHAQRFERGKKEGVPLGSDVDDAVDHQVATDQHQDGRGIEGEGLLLRLIQTGAVVGEVGGKLQLRQPLILQNLLGLLFQLAGLVEGDAEGDAGGVFAVIARHQLSSCLCRNPGAGLRKVGRAVPPAAQGELVGVLLPLRVGPLQSNRRAQLMRDAQRVHGQLVQRDLSRLLRQAAGGGQREHCLGVGLVGHRQLDRPLADHRVRELSEGAQPHRAFDVDMLGKQVRLVLGQAGIQDVAGGAVGVLVVEQKGVLHRAAHQKDKGVQGGDQHGGEGQNEIFGPMKAKVPLHQRPADL